MAKINVAVFKIDPTQLKLQKKSAFFLLCIFVLISCSENGSEHKNTEPKYGPENIYKITIPIGGDDFASSEEMETINRIAFQITDQKIGAIISTGSGMGRMTIIFKLNKGKSLESVKNIVHEVYPKAGYRIEPEVSFPVEHPELRP